MSFDWQTDDRAEWPEAAPPPDTPPKRRRWRWAAGLALLLLTTAVLARAWLQRLDSVTGQLKAEILASDAVLQGAAARGDGEIFATFLSGRDADWAAATTKLAGDGAIYRRSGLGLTWLPGETVGEPEVTLAPDLRTAEVTHDMAYAINVGNGLTETVVLRQTAVYRTGSNRWLLSPPERSFWGADRTISGQYLTVHFPTRDASLVERLFLRIDDKLGEMCTQLPTFSCPSNFQVEVVFSTAPESLAQADLLGVLATESPPLLLPTPTLAGLPQTEEAYQALFRGYASLVLAAAITDIVDWRCCEQAVFYKAVLNELLHELGLRPEPVTTAEFETLWQEAVPLAAGAEWWQGDGRSEAALPGAIVGLAHDVWGQTAVAVARSLADNPHQSYSGWLHLLAGPDFPRDEELQQAWRAFVYAQSASGQAARPIPYPNQDLQLLCRPDLEQRLALFRYDLSSGDFQLEQPLNQDVAYMAALPHGDGLAIWERSDRPNVNGLYLWHDGLKIDLSWEKTPSSAGSVPYRLDPTGERLILVPDNIVDATYGLLDVGACLTKECQVATVPGFPVVSPDGQRAIALESTFPPTYAQSHGILKLVDGEGEVLTAVGEGTSPFWIDAQTFAYVLDAGEGRRDTLMRGSLDDPVPEKWLSVDEITAVLPDTDRLRLIDYATMTPDPNILALITTRSQAEGGVTEFLAYDLTTQKLAAHEILSSTVLGPHEYLLSPDGRWLLLRLLNAGEWTILWIDLTTFTSQRLVVQPPDQLSLAWGADWSADGNWLALSDSDLVRLLAPAYNYETLFIPRHTDCLTAVWVQPTHE
ncbi:MAG: hypothetical protein H6659_05705 [Ardenticatenaceae bacterium]|nr:hypothetical protein [Ardenticatenaceae bacterium]